MVRRIWTEAEKVYLLEHYADNFTEDIAAALGRPIDRIHRMANSMGLKKSKRILAEHGKRVQGHPNVLAGRFKKGDIPVNKGQKMSPEKYEKCSATMFKKGSIPHNTHSDGYCSKRSDGYWYYRVSLDKWDLIHRKVWEDAHGPIPKDMIVMFKDGNRDN